MCVKFELIIIRYGEIALKSNYIRKKFESILINNIKTIFNKEKITNEIKRERGRIYLYTDKTDRSLIILKKIFGIVNFSPSTKTSSDIKSISKKAVNLSNEYLNKNMSFAVRTNRTGGHNYTSQDVSVKIGKEIQENTGCIVDLANPDFELFIDIRKENAYLFKEKINGPGGMPVGSQDRVLCFIDNIYSILACFYILRRGCKPLFFVKKDFDDSLLNSFVEQWYIDSEKFVYSENNNFYSELNKKVSEKKCKAVVTGFFNLKNDFSKIKEFKKNIDVSILHPLISFDENNLEEKLKEIGVSK